MIRKIYISIYLLFGALTVSQAQQEAQVQSAFMYHFTNYMQWPAAKQQGDFVITVVGSDPIENFLKALAASKKVGLQKITVKKVSSISEISDSHIIYMSDASLGQFESAKTVSKNKNALLVTSKDGYAKRGAGINFVVVGGKPKFEINESKIAASSIKVGAKLVQIGIKVN